jgi:uncharacterized protein YdiU (UPF0061 family)
MTKNDASISTGWNFDNSYARLPQSFFSKLEPNPVPEPNLVILNDSLATSIGLKAEGLKSEENIAVFSGNRMPEGSLPLAQAYAGHQFGHFTMLGDGRAMLIGEQITPSGERVDIQLKGSGRTPFSRGGDGRAALGPMLREYIISEAMHVLRIPTTRSLAVATTGESIVREKDLPGAILTRVAASHLRFGTFQYAANWGTIEELRTLADYAIQRHYPEIESDDSRYLTFFQRVLERHASLVAKWQLVGFIHGVMNTDNMTINGETIDYGPCAFMDTYDPKTVFSSIDVQGRYAYGNQPPIIGWNLARFAEALLPLFHKEQEKAIEIAEKALSQFPERYDSYWLSGMRAKLGLYNEEAEDKELIRDLLNVMQTHHADYTNTFLALTFNKLEELEFFRTVEFTDWHGRWETRRSRQHESTASSQQSMRDNNPAIIPRNHLVEAALEAAVERDDFTVMHRLLDALSNPFEHTNVQAKYAKMPKSPSTTPYRTFCGT